MSYWTDKYFGSLYHEIYSTHLLDPQRALEESAFAAHVLNLGRRVVVDVACGFGRHARLLAQSNRVIAIDRTAGYLHAAQEHLPERSRSNLLLARAGMRDIPVRDKLADGVVMLFNSFGYFGAQDDVDGSDTTAPARQVWKLPSVFYERQLVDSNFGSFKDPAPAAEGAEEPLPGRAKLDESVATVSDANLHVLQEIHRCLKPGGGLLLEVPNRRLLLEAIEENPRRLMVLEGYEIHEQFEFDAASNRVVNRTRFVAGEREEAASYSLRLYGSAEIRQLLQEAGFRVERIYGDYEGGRYGPASSDVMLIHARRPSRIRS